MALAPALHHPLADEAGAMTEPRQSDSGGIWDGNLDLILVRFEDFEASSWHVGHTASSEACGFELETALRFLEDAGHMLENRSPREIAAWAFAIGIMAERHRVHREEHGAR